VYVIQCVCECVCVYVTQCFVCVSVYVCVCVRDSVFCADVVVSDQEVFDKEL